MKSNVQHIAPSDWKILLQELSTTLKVLVLVEDFQHEAQMIDHWIDSISETHPDMNFYRLNTYPEHPILEDLRIRFLPAFVVIDDGEITYVSDEPLNRNILSERLAQGHSLQSA